MDIQFIKMQADGNDYILLNCLEQRLKHPEQLASRLCERHYSVGADGLIVLEASEKADVEMHMFNADGSENRMCGNALRCVGKYLHDRGLTTKTELSVETKSGMRTLRLMLEQALVVMVEVEMGKPSFLARDIPVETDYDDFISQPMLVMGEVYLVTCVSIGNPHAVIFCEDVETMPLELIGPLFEEHEKFPDRVNADFVQCVDRRTLRMRVWERGCGETLACGSGACSAVAAAVMNDFCDYDTEISVQLPGGKIHVTYRKEDHSILLKGTSAFVFDGHIQFT